MQDNWRLVGLGTTSVSVIIPTWNRGNTIVQAVRSALNQSTPPLEVLVCDDGSSDNSFELVKSIGDPRIKWLVGPRGGRPAIPRNRGIKESRGEWLAFLDSDDEWLSHKLEQQLALAEKLNCKAVSSNAYRYIPGQGKAGNLLEWQEERIPFSKLAQCNQVICSSSLVHKSLFPAVAGFPEGPELKALEDYALWLRVSTFTDFAYVNEPLLLYRDDAANSVRCDDPAEHVQREKVFANFVDWAKAAARPKTYLREARRHYQTALERSGKEIGWLDRLKGWF